MKISFKLDNSSWNRTIREAQRELERVNKRISVVAMRRSLTPIVKEVRKQAPVDTGSLKKSIGKRIIFYKKPDGATWGGVSVRIEKGTANVKWKNIRGLATKFYFKRVISGETGSFIAGIKPNPFIQRAWANVSPTLNQKMAMEYKKEWNIRIKA